MPADFLHCITLISNPAAPAVNDEALDAARATLEGLGAAVAKPTILAEGIAYDIPCAVPNASAAVEAVRGALDGRPIDVTCLPIEGRKRDLLIADMDSTMITVECIDEIADLVGVKPQVAAITERAMRGELDFNDALRERVELLKDLEADRLNAVYTERVQFTPGGAALVATMRSNGAFTALVSGGFSFFADKVCEALGFHWSQANDLDIGKDGKLTGEVLPPILGKEAKAHALQAIAAQKEIPLSKALALGDGANDLDMIGLAGLGAAFHAKPKVAEAADIRIDHGDLTALLYVQGYKREEFVGGRL